MDIVLIGSGNVATALGRMIRTTGHRVVQVFSRTFGHAQTLGQELGASATDRLSSLDQSADLCIIATSDSTIREIAGQLRLPQGILVHTAGAVPMQVLANSAPQTGVLYPLQSLRKEIPVPDIVPLLIDADDTGTLHTLKHFAEEISPQVHVANDSERLRLHVAAVFSNNFSNYLLALTEKFCEQEGLDYRLLLPLFRETTARLSLLPAEALQTGPAIRGDRNTMDKHLEILRNYPAMQEIYLNLSTRIMDSFASKKSS